MYRMRSYVTVITTKMRKWFLINFAKNKLHILLQTMHAARKHAHKLHQSDIEFNVLTQSKAYLWVLYQFAYHLLEDWLLLTENNK